MGLIKDNKELDSTLSILFVFVAFLIVLSAILTLIIRALEVPDVLKDIFQHVKELVQIILVYHFTKSIPPALAERLKSEQNAEGGTPKTPPDV